MFGCASTHLKRTFWPVNTILLFCKHALLSLVKLILSCNYHIEASSVCNQNNNHHQIAATIASVRHHHHSATKICDSFLTICLPQTTPQFCTNKFVSFMLMRVLSYWSFRLSDLQLQYSVYHIVTLFLLF
jgi:hypothetical protein